MKSKLLKCIGLLIGLVFVISLIPHTSATAVPVWEDNFNDRNYNGWTVKTGLFSCMNKTLAGTYDSTPEGNSMRFDNEIWANSTVSYGTWSFDLYFGGQSNYGPGLWFACDGISSDAEWTGVGWPGGKGVALQREGNYWAFHRVSGWSSGFSNYWDATPDGSIGLETGYHVYFTYDEIGYFDIWINGTYLGQGANFKRIYHFQSQNVLVALNRGSWIDNIQVWNETLPLPDPVLDAISPNPDSDGDVLVNWNDDIAAENWSVYQSSSEITELNVDSATEIASGLTESLYTDTGLSVGTYWYAVAAIDSFGYSHLSNSVNVTVAATTTTTTTADTTFSMDTVLLIAAAGVGGIVIIAAVVLMRRR
ncbi:MAG: hypothetical protein ACXACG_02200 [Candidatus Thorarchaeota archaeon]